LDNKIGVNLFSGKALVLAIKTKNVEMVKLLVNSGIDFNGEELKNIHIDANENFLVYDYLLNNTLLEFSGKKIEDLKLISLVGSFLNKVINFKITKILMRV
jgi:hypothetical protein